MGNSFQKIMHYVGKHGIVRPRDIEAIGLPRECRRSRPKRERVRRLNFRESLGISSAAHSILVQDI